MIFSPEFTDAIQSGRKTVTRRPANGQPCSHRVGSIQKVQPGQGQPALPGRIQITKISLEPLAEITGADARREGFRGRHPRTAFLNAWDHYYGLPMKRLVYRIEFEYVPAS